MGNSFLPVRWPGPLRRCDPVLGEETVFTYTLDVEIGPEDLGFDRVHIGLPGVVQQVRFDGVVLPEDAYEAGWDDEGLWLVLGPSTA